MSVQTVGIDNYTCPVRIQEKNGGCQQTVATVNLLVSMPGNRLESSVSIMTSLLARIPPDLHIDLFSSLLTGIRDQLQAGEVRLTMSFPYFVAKKAPVSGTSSLMEYQCTFTASSETEGEPLLTVHVPLTTLCPCSKEISTVGAHNQRAEVTLTIRPLALIWLEDLISLVESCGSSQVYALLKRPDEKYVTEAAYAQPMFVEDVARKVAQKAFSHADIAWFSVGVESFESIHKHSAYAFVDSRDLEMNRPT
ncbi:GTP cyclohydrolase I FolE2 [Desulfobulbus alkaliphilus]|uniref:GTP cyclohydrolase I FolE2 n=1 Tax=Desulfobulbus alkaliphilus TaxID=869814 RepID=UPI001963D59D|nr:GTP cyclohydrolase, FolE2/MptA family [Desulfobulbus alkaliphilus]MBM9537978.1 GTP cyclohydrolase I FolE2 [Desulfobulbus alkaliphilus]